MNSGAGAPEPVPVVASDSTVSILVDKSIFVIAFAELKYKLLESVAILVRESSP